MKHLSLNASVVFLGLALSTELSAQGPSYETFGTGCPGTAGTPAIDRLGASLPFLGGSLRNQVKTLPDSGMAIALLGLSKTNLSGTPLPADLGIVGMPGCKLYTSILRTRSLSISSGRATWNTDIPDDLSLMGLHFYQQVVVFDPTVPDIGIIMSNAADAMVSDLPDLAVTSGVPTVNPLRIPPGSLVRMSAWTVKNQGRVPAGAFLGGYFLSTGQLISNQARLLYSTSFGALAPGESATIPSLDIRIPSDIPPGDYWIGVKANWDNGIPELVPLNNFKTTRLTVLGPQPDLIVSLAAPTVSPGTIFVSSFLPNPIIDVSTPTIHNQGIGDAGAFSIGCYLSTDSKITASDTLLRSVWSSGLVAGGFHTFSIFSFGGIPVSNLTMPGAYWIGFLVDNTDLVTESHEDNNDGLTRQFWAQPPPFPFPEK